MSCCLLQVFIRCYFLTDSCFFFFFKQKTPDEMRISDWSSDVCSSDLANHYGFGDKAKDLWREMGYSTGNGRDMTSVMHRMSGLPIHEQTLGSADAMLLRLLDGDESMGGTKQPYDPRIHFVLIRDAYLDANPKNEKLRAWLDDAIAKFDKVYARSEEHTS